MGVEGDGVGTAEAEATGGAAGVAIAAATIAGVSGDARGAARATAIGIFSGEEQPGGESADNENCNGEDAEEDG